MRQACEDVSVDALQVIGITKRDMDEVVRRPGQKITRQHFGHFDNGRFEGIEECAALPVKGDMHKCIAWQTGRFRIKQ